MDTRIMQRLIFAAFLSLLALLSEAATLAGDVVGVADGDTLTVLDEGKRQHKIRLLGIDAPESHQAFGQKSKQALSDLAFQRQVIVEWDKQDKYKRALGKIILNGTDINLKQIEAGLAWHYKHFQKDQGIDDRALYSKAEEAARGARRGLWADTNPIPPWDFRQGAKPGKQATGCGTKTKCSEMDTCEEATHYLRCGVKSLDADKDGTPCESLCGKVRN